KEAKRLTIGPPDFDASFSTVPDFDIIHARVQQLLASASGPQSAAPLDGIVQPAMASGRLQASGPLQQTTPPPPSADFTPVTTTPDGEPITEAMLNKLKSQGNEQALRDLVA